MSSGIVYDRVLREEPFGLAGMGGAKELLAKIFDCALFDLKNYYGKINYLAMTWGHEWPQPPLRLEFVVHVSDWAEGTYKFRLLSRDPAAAHGLVASMIEDLGTPEEAHARVAVKAGRKLPADYIEALAARDDAMTADLLERLSILEHAQWVSACAYILKTTEAEVDEQLDYHLSELETAFVDFSALECVKRWKRQGETPYEELSEKEKDSDREWGRKAMEIFMAWRQDWRRMGDE